MRIVIKCNSPLLQQTLLSYLNEYIYEYELADVLISDINEKSEKVLFRIGFDLDADLMIPFSKDELIKKLNKLYETNPRLQKIQNTQEVLEEAIKRLNKKHKEKIAKLMKSYYAKR